MRSWEPSRNHPNTMLKSYCWWPWALELEKRATKSSKNWRNNFRIYSKVTGNISLLKWRSRGASILTSLCKKKLLAPKKIRMGSRNGSKSRSKNFSRYTANTMPRLSKSKIRKWRIASTVTVFLLLITPMKIIGSTSTLNCIRQSSFNLLSKGLSHPRRWKSKLENRNSMINELDFNKNHNIWIINI